MGSEKLRVFSKWCIPEEVTATDEFQASDYDFWYAEDVYVDVKNDTLIYTPKFSSEVGVYASHPFDENTRIQITNQTMKQPQVVYDRVGIVPYRDHYNLFHFLEGTNTIIEYYLNDQLNASVCFIGLSSPLVLLSLSGSRFRIAFVSWLVSWLSYGCPIWNS